MIAEESRAAYRAACTYRRNSHVIEELVSGKWTTYKTYGSINRAKAAVRNHLVPGKTYTV